MNGTRRFYDWERPALDQAMQVFSAHWKNGVLDLHDRLIVVPTRHAGRRLRERFALEASLQGGAVLPGQVVTPEDLYQPDRSASLFDEVAVWLAVFLENDLSRYAALFPGANDDFSPEPGIAYSLIRLRKLLADENLAFSDVLEQFELNPEPERWQALLELEALYLDKLSSIGLTDGVQAGLALARNPEISDAIKYVDVLFCPDLSPAAATWLQGCSQTLPVCVHVHAAPGMKDYFDEWGRPVAVKWNDVPMPLGNEQIRVTMAPSACASSLTGMVKRLPEERRTGLAVGVPDAELVPHLRSELDCLGIHAFDPAGDSMKGHRIVMLLDHFLQLIRDDGFLSFQQLIRHPDVRLFFEKNAGEYNFHEVLSGLDHIQRDRFPSSFRDVERSERLDGVFRVVSGWVDELRAGAIYEHLPIVLQEIYQDCSNTDTHTARVAEKIISMLNEWPELLNQSVSDPAGQMELLLQQLEHARLYEERQKDSIDLLGWAELAWEDAPVLLVAGMHEHAVPESVTGDIFLPNSARRELGVRDNDYLLARDLYMMHVLLHCRSERNIHFLVNRKSRNGDPLKPSRLLFQCEPDELAERVELLFSSDALPAPVCKFPEWNLTPPVREHKPSISVTSFRDYLECPFRYYLKNVLKMESLDVYKMEMDARDFGHLCHHALEEFGKDPEIRECHEMDVIAGFLTSRVRARAKECYGVRLSAAAEIQLENACRRLQMAAAIQARERAEGWQIIDAEYPVENKELLGSLTLKGTIDRIERNGQTGQIRVLDYKTFDSLQDSKCESKHFAPVRENTPEYALAPNGKRWVDLQLPLYVHLLEAQYGSDITTGYFVLGRSAAETDIFLWHDLDGEFLSSALECARNIAGAVKKGLFYPPAPKVHYEHFESVLGTRPESEINWRGGGA